MAPYLVRLSYLGQSWTDVMLEVSHNELGDADKPECTRNPADNPIGLRRGIPLGAV